MQLQGNLTEFSLPNVLQLVKMSAKTGTLTLRCEERWGRLYFRSGHIYYAFVDPQVMPLGERLVRSGAITPRQLEEGLGAQRAGPESTRLGTVLEQLGFIDRGTLAEAIGDQIEEAAFDLLGWLEGEFEFLGDAPPADEDIVLELTVDGVIIDGCRRIDEWDLVMASLGSLQHIPRLEYAEGVDNHGGVSFTPEEWRVISLVDGRRDAGSVIRDSGINRFRAAKVLRRLVEEGLAIMRPAAIEGLENATAVVVRSPIDFYTEVFLSTLNEETLTRHLLAVNSRRAGGRGAHGRRHAAGRGGRGRADAHLRPRLRHPRARLAGAGRPLQRRHPARERQLGRQRARIDPRPGGRRGDRRRCRWSWPSTSPSPTSPSTRRSCARTWRWPTTSRSSPVSCATATRWPRWWWISPCRAGGRPRP